MESEVIHKGPANYFRGIESVGGDLTLFADRLYFESHGIAIQADPETILLKDVAQVSTRNSLGIIPNGLLVVTHHGKKHKFVVRNRSEWVEKISTLLKK